MTAEQANGSTESRPILFRWRDAIKSSDLPATARHILLNLATHMTPEGEDCFPGIRLQGKETGLNKDTVSKHLQKLAGVWFTRERRGRAGQGWVYQYWPRVPHSVRTNRTASNEEGPRSSHEGVRVERAKRTGSPSKMSEEPIQSGSGSESESDPSTDAYASGRRPEKVNSKGGARSAGISSRQQLLERGTQTVGARFGPLIRDELYPPDGRPPDGYAAGRDIRIVETLLHDGYRPEQLVLAIRGLARARDAGELKVAGPGEKLTCRVLLSDDVAGSRDTVGHFEEIGRRAQHYRQDDEKAGKAGLAKIGDVLRGQGYEPRRKDGTNGRGADS